MRTNATKPCEHAAATERVVTVFVSDEQSSVALDLTRWVRLAQLALAEERIPADAELALIFVEEDSITDLNQRFLDGPGATDVLAFPIDDDLVPGGRRPDEGGRGPGSPAEPDEDPPLVLGDVVICPVVAARQAPEHDASFDEELALLVVHGILHLLNYDHAEEREAHTMRRRERELLELFRQHDEV